MGIIKEEVDDQDVYILDSDRKSVQVSPHDQMNKSQGYQIRVRQTPMKSSDDVLQCHNSNKAKIKINVRVPD